MNVTLKTIAQSKSQLELQIDVDGRPFEGLTLELLDWDTKVLGLASGRLTNWQPRADDSPPPDGIYRPLAAELPSLGLEYVTARIGAHGWRRVHNLERAGFRLIDGIIEFSLALAPAPAAPAEAQTWRSRLATLADAEKVAALSVSCFKYSRFHNDPLLTRAQADRVHYVWAKNSVLGQAAQAVWIVEEATRMVGFITCLVKGTRGQISLVAVDTAMAGRGIGRALTRSALGWFAEQGCTTLTVQTQSDNLAAIRLYTGMGMLATDTALTLRWAARDPA